MVNSHRVALLDGGATAFKAEVVDYERVDGFPAVTGISYSEFPTTQDPNDSDEDYRRVQAMLGELEQEHGFKAIVAGIAAIVGRDGVIGRGASLNWHGKNLGQLLASDFPGVPNAVANDGTMFGAYEIVFGALKDPKYRGRNFVVIVPGTGIGTCFGIWTGSGWQLMASEVQHTPYDRSRPPEGCNCGNYCFDSAASGAMYRRAGIDPATLDEAEDVARIAPPVGTLVASCVMRDPSGLDLVVVAGRTAHKRHSLIGAIRDATAAELHGFAGTPEFILGSDGSGGTRGALAYGLHTGLLR
jgi:predicted NBD/HSP70 family sugar kinase